MMALVLWAVISDFKSSARNEVVHVNVHSPIIYRWILVGPKMKVWSPTLIDCFWLASNFWCARELAVTKWNWPVTFTNLLPVTCSCILFYNIVLYLQPKDKKWVKNILFHSDSQIILQFYSIISLATFKILNSHLQTREKLKISGLMIQ